MDNKKLGTTGEDLACEYLKRNGYDIVERNKSYPKVCEVDIVAKRKDKYYFIEVKTRTNENFGTAKDAVDKKKLKHILKGVHIYVNEHKIKNFQIDVIAITLKPEFKLEHYRNAC